MHAEGAKKLNLRVIVDIFSETRSKIFKLFAY